MAPVFGLFGSQKFGLEEEQTPLCRTEGYYQCYHDYRTGCEERPGQLNTFLSLLFLIFVCVILFALAWGRHVEVKTEAAVAKEFPIGKEAIFTGRYVSHWEVPSFEWHKDGKVRIGQNLRCELIIRYEGGWDWLLEALGPDDSFDFGPVFDLEFRGKITGKGFFGHMGGNQYEIEVLEMLSVRPRSEDRASLLRGSDAPKPPPDELLHPAKGSSPTDPETLLRPDENEDY